MKYGMPTLLEFNNINDNVNFAKANNLDFIELNMNLPYCFNLKKKELIKHNFEFTMHISEELNVAELNDNLRKKYLNEIVRQINIGISNNIKRYTIHLDSGIYFTLKDGKSFLNNTYIELFKKHMIDSCEILNSIAKENNILINFENTKIQDFTIEAINTIMNYECLGFTLDIGHSEKNKNKAWEILKSTNKIRHIHMHDYDSTSDHLAIGKGIINFSKYKDVLKKCYIVIEVKNSDELLDSIKTISEN